MTNYIKKVEVYEIDVEGFSPREMLQDLVDFLHAYSNFEKTFGFQVSYHQNWAMLIYVNENKKIELDVSKGSLRFESIDDDLLDKLNNFSSWWIGSQFSSLKTTEEN